MGTGCVTLNGCPKDEKRKEDGKLGWKHILVW
jgi:hypothetical protein